MQLNIKILCILSCTLFLLSCASDKNLDSLDAVIASGDIAEMRTMKNQLDAQKADITQQLSRLEEKIKELDPQQKIPLITTFSADQQEFEHYIELQGDVATKKNIIIYPEYSGVLSEVYVREGQRVAQGQKLAKIEDGGLSQQLAQLQIQADLARSAFERQQRLWNQKIGSEMAYLEAKTNYEAQQKSISQLQEQIAKTIVRAPFGGTIDEIITERGTVVAPGAMGLFRIVNLQNMYIETDVPEVYINDIKPGRRVVVEFPVLDMNMESKVRQVGNFIDPANRTFKIQVDVHNRNQNIKPNLMAKLKINDYTNEKAILIPLSIISENAEEEQFVYAVDSIEGNQGIARQVIIQTGKTQGDMIEVLSGIQPGMHIISEGARSVRDNQEVRILGIDNAANETDND